MELQTKLKFRLEAKYSKDSLVANYTEDTVIQLTDCDYSLPTQNGSVTFLWDISLISTYFVNIKSNFILFRKECGITDFKITKVIKDASEE